MALMKGSGNGPKAGKAKVGAAAQDKHPRGPNGQFVKKSGSGASPAKGETKGLKGGQPTKAATLKKQQHATMRRRVAAGAAVGTVLGAAFAGGFGGGQKIAQSRKVRPAPQRNWKYN